MARDEARDVIDHMNKNSEEDREKLIDAMSDVQIVSEALGIAIDETEALVHATGEGFEDEDLALWQYVKRVFKAASAGDLSSIRAELKLGEV